jgi:hypothetical protein
MSQHLAATTLASRVDWTRSMPRRTTGRWLSRRHSVLGLGALGELAPGFYWRKWMATFGMSRNGTCSHTRGGGRFDVKCQGCTHLKPQLTLLIKPPLNLHDLTLWPAQHERERFRCWTEPEPCRWPPNGSARAAARGVGQSASNLSQAT